MIIFYISIRSSLGLLCLSVVSFMQAFRILQLDASLVALFIWIFCNMLMSSFRHSDHNCIVYSKCGLTYFPLCIIRIQKLFLVEASELPVNHSQYSTGFRRCFNALPRDYEISCCIQRRGKCHKVSGARVFWGTKAQKLQL